MSNAEREDLYKKIRKSLIPLIAPQGKASREKLEEDVAERIKTIEEQVKSITDDENKAKIYKRKIAYHLWSNDQTALSKVREGNQLTEADRSNEEHQKKYAVQIAALALKQLEA